ncbi:MAG TPA: hypothetical protein VGP63_04790 [Planctomycetaceae bacterium]|jgi:hypothetical protein|nr:hypothetical protein [Planctomycetaceae bacterium]
MNRHRFVVIFLASALFLNVGEEVAQAQVPSVAPLRSKLMLRFRRARSGSPIPVTWKFDWPDRTVVRGTLEYEAYDETSRLAEFRIPDFVLSPGKNEFNLLFPAFFVGSSASWLTIHSRFVTSHQTFEFAEQTLRVPTQYVQWFSVGVVAGAQARPSAAETRFFDKIRLESSLPAEASVNQSATASFEVKIGDLPSDPLTLCNFDVLVLTPTGLAELRADQAGAIRKWVAAGGSVCVVVGSSLESRQVELLNDLTSELLARPKFVVGPKEVMPDEDSPGKILTATKGLGRVVLVRPKFFETLDPDAKAWIDTARFLLKGRKNAQAGWDDESEFLQANGRAAKGVPARNPPVLAPRGWSGDARITSLNAAPLGHLDELFALLMPVGVSAIPLGVIALILAAYVVTIGPIDYFVLGALRLRRFTWVLFPVVTIGFAAYTLWLSQRYLGSTDSRRAIEIFDVVPGGTVARRSRIEMLFLSQENAVSTQVDNGLFSVVGRGIFMNRGPLPPDMMRETSQTIGVAERFPNNYQIVQQIPQWRPVLNRFFWIDPKPSVVCQPPGLPGVAGFDWDAAGRDLLGSTGGVALAERVRRAFGPQACALVMRGSSMIFVLNDLEELPHWRANFGLSTVRAQKTNYLTETVRELCQRTPQQLFLHASNVSPNGGPELDDLAVSDSTDPAQSVLVIAVETESTLYLYRRVFSGSP